jgi:hypothetical protein
LSEQFNGQRFRVRMWRALGARRALTMIGLLLFAPIPPAEAARSLRVYDVTVPTADQSSMFASALRKALVRATGQSDIDQDPLLQSVLANPRRYVQLFRPAAGGGTQVVFDGASLDRAILGAGRSLWPRERPIVMLVLDAASDESLRKSAQQAAEDRGLPVLWQPAASAGIGVDAGPEAALAAARRNGADYALLGSAAGVGRWNFVLHAPSGIDLGSAANNWSGSIESAIGVVAESLARSSINVLVQPELEVLVRVAGVDTLRDYADVTRALSALTGVKSVLLLEVAAGAAAYRMLMRGGEDSLQSALASDNRFTTTERQSGRVQLQFRR